MSDLWNVRSNRMPPTSGGTNHRWLGPPVSSGNGGVGFLGPPTPAGNGGARYLGPPVGSGNGVSAGINGVPRGTSPPVHGMGAQLYGAQAVGRNTSNQSRVIGAPAVPNSSQGSGGGMPNYYPWSGPFLGWGNGSGGSSGQTSGNTGGQPSASGQNINRYPGVGPGIGTDPNNNIGNPGGGPITGSPGNPGGGAGGTGGVPSGGYTGAGHDNTDPGPPSQGGTYNGFVPPVSGTPMTGGQYGFWAPLPERVAGPSSLQSWASGMLPYLFGTPAGVNAGYGFGGSAYSTSGLTPNGSGLLNNPALQNAQTAYTNTVMPEILQQQEHAMGSTRNTGAENAVARGWANMSLPLMQGELAREENAINRQTSTDLNLARLFPQIAMENAGRNASLLNEGMGFGNVGRQIAQDANRAQYNDLLRRQALWEDLFKVPMGQSSQTFGRSMRGGGLFK